MASRAGFEIQIAAERAPAVMAGCARVISSRKVLQCARRVDLPSLRQADTIIMTVSTTQSLSRAVLCMAESKVERGGVGRCPRIRFLSVTDAARRQVATVRLRARNVTGVATCVSREPRGNRQRHAASQR